MAEEIQKASETKLSDHLVHWFFAVVSLAYGCGFVIVFTFFKSYGIDSTDLIEAKYVHIGFLFALSCLVVITPIWWLIWPHRGKVPNVFKFKINEAFSKTTWASRWQYLSQPIRRYFFPEWFVNAKHGIHTSNAVRISMILVLWSFISLVLFAKPSFGKEHPKLTIVNFLAPMIVLIFGLLADLFKDGAFVNEQLAELTKVRCILRIWWPLVGVFYICMFPFHVLFFERHCRFLAGFYFVPPITIILTNLVDYFIRPGGATELDRLRTRIGIWHWFWYTTHWAVVIWQFWAFIWTIKSDALGVSYPEILFGASYLRSLQNDGFSFTKLFPHGGIYFIFMVLLAAFFLMRNSYRLKQMEELGDAAHRWATNFSSYLIVLPLCYISMLAFAHYIYPYIPYDKGGGDYSRSRIATLCFNTNSSNSAGIQIAIPQQMINLNFSNRLIVLDESSSDIFLADIKSGGGPLYWRSGDGKPAVYQIRPEAVTVIYQTDQ